MATATQTHTRPSIAPRNDTPRAWNVVLLDDDDHTYEYVIEMLMKLFRVPLERAFEMAKTVDGQKRVVCMTTHKELAELKREQIHGYGRDFRIQLCKGSMSAIIEPAMSGEDDSFSHGPPPQP